MAGGRITIHSLKLPSWSLVGGEADPLKYLLFCLAGYTTNRRIIGCPTHVRTYAQNCTHAK